MEHWRDVPEIIRQKEIAEKWKARYMRLRFKFGLYLLMIPITALAYLVVQINSYFRG